MIGVYIVGEDDVTRHVIYRILSYCGAGRFTVLMELPARGGEIKNKIPNFNQLAMKFPVILLTDLDADNCAPELKRKLLGGLEQAENLVFNVAVDEAEAWLMADRDGFAKYISVDVDQLPCAGLQKQGGAKAFASSIIFRTGTDIDKYIYWMVKIMSDHFPICNSSCQVYGQIGW